MKKLLSVTALCLLACSLQSSPNPKSAINNQKSSLTTTITRNPSTGKIIGFKQTRTYKDGSTTAITRDPATMAVTSREYTR